MTNQQDVISDAVTWLTANGNNDLYETLVYWREGAPKNLGEAIDNDWVPKGDWNKCWDEVADEIGSCLFHDGAKIYRSKTGIELRDATEEECKKYVRMVENHVGHVDGEPFGFESGIYIEE